MIVKNEAPVIQRCLASVRPIIDHWLIVDTGSTDGTQDIIRAVMRDVTGEVVERPWVDFGHNRSEALALARRHGDYSLIIDADDELLLPPGFKLSDLDADSYVVDIIDRAVTYQRPQVVRNAITWRYRGVLHEFLACDDAKRSGHLPIQMRVNRDGRRSTDPLTYTKDAAVLEHALVTETDPFLIARYTFYLAQSYRDSGSAEASVKTYLRRATQGHWDQEIFISLLQAGRLMETLGGEQEDVLAVYQRATDACPSRAEAAHAASRLCRALGQNRRGYAIAKAALGLPAPADGLFVEPWIYHYGLFDEYAVNAYWAGYYSDSIEGALRALESGKASADDQGRLIQNARFAAQKLAETGSGSTPPAEPREPVRELHGRIKDPAPRVLLAILVKQKAPVLPLYLECIEALDYPKASIVLYVRTNNNTDETRDILRAWVDRVRSHYASVIFDDSDVDVPVETFGVHEWNAQRFGVLAAIRNVSLRQTIEHACDFYFVVDADNFVIRSTLRNLVALDLPIAAPLLRDVRAGSRYANFHADVDANGYFVGSSRYDEILTRAIIGVIELPVVHCTYLVRADVIDRLRYDDTSGRHEYVIFSEQARANGIPQYIDNRQVYGYLTLDDATPAVVASQLGSIADFLHKAAGHSPKVGPGS